MTEDKPQRTFDESVGLLGKLARMSLYAVPYVIGLAGLYLVTFWKSLDINPFDFAGAPDLLPQSIASLVLLAVVVVPAILIMMLFTKSVEALTKTPQKSSPRAQFVGWCFYTVAWIACFILSDGHIRWFVVMFAITAPVANACRKIFSGVLTKNELLVTLVLLYMIPGIEVCVAHLRAYNIVYDNDGRRVDLIASSIAPFAGESGRKLFYIGKLGKYFFFREEGSDAVMHIVPEDEVKRLSLFPADDDFYSWKLKGF